jgi:hypothetical protein
LRDSGDYWPPEPFSGSMRQHKLRARGFLSILRNRRTPADRMVEKGGFNSRYQLMEEFDGLPTA